MPVGLAKIASQNLATEDASIAKVNAAGRLNPMPGVGAPGSTPQTDATNLATAAGMDRADLGNRFGFGSPQYQQGTETPATPTLADTHADDIATRRSALDDQRKQIMTRLGVIQPEPGTAVVLAGPKERQQLLQNWHMVETESQNLLKEEHDNAIDSARTAHENFTRQTHINSANDFSAMSNDLLQLQNDPNTQPGTPEFHARALEIAKNHPAGFMTQAGQTLFRGVSDMHDKAASLEDRSYWQRFGQSFKEASQVGRKRGVDVQYDDQGFPSIDLTSKVGGEGAVSPDEADKELYNSYGIRQTNLLNPQSVRIVGQPKSSDPGDTSGNFVEVKTFAKGEPVTKYMPKADYLKFGGKLAPDATAASTPSGTPDLKALAQKALNDPNASEAHKAAAKKILGQ